MLIPESNRISITKTILQINANYAFNGEKEKEINESKNYNEFIFVNL